ncbi:MAG: hypothetical protein LQ345_005751 [Seirophora villosa]|nr:MAG: hypothetical protein LQ345_005751 [Seirophora villosa]
MFNNEIMASQTEAKRFLAQHGLEVRHVRHHDPRQPPRKARRRKTAPPTLPTGCTIETTQNVESCTRLRAERGYYPDGRKEKPRAAWERAGADNRQNPPGDLGRAVERHHVQGHGNDNAMTVKLRLPAEEVYGNRAHGRL